jgi:hypothetical protein
MKMQASTATTHPQFQQPALYFSFPWNLFIWRSEKEWEGMQPGEG